MTKRMRQPLSLAEKGKRYCNAKIWPTFACTMTCCRCAAWTGQTAHKDYILSWDHYTTFIKRLIEQGIHLGLLDFSGGEPTLWPHLRQAIIHAKQKKIANTIRVISNGLNRIASDYGDADLVCVSHYGGQNIVDLIRLKRELGRRLSIVRAAHIDPRIQQHSIDVLPANCTCIRMCLVGNKVYPCAMKAIYNEDGIDVSANFYAHLCNFQADMQERCRSCMTNYNVIRDRIPPIVLEGGIVGSPYNILLNVRGKFVGIRRWLARRYMRRLARKKS